MAGIAGWIHWRHNIQEQQGVLAGMLAALAHRGPDGQTLWLDEGSPAALGQRRRGSLDLTRRGRPPAPHWVLALDGEIYNLEQLREELARRGHPCPDGTPGEVVLQCYRAWGIACLQRLEGPFALALWDGTRRSLLLARDPLGIRPLFFARRGETLIFASEIKALLAHPHIRPQVDSQGLAELWLMGPGRTPGQGVFKGIGELRAGEFKTIGPGRAWRQRYWHLYSREHPDDAPTTAAVVQELTTVAIGRQLGDPAGTCVMLSGGLDSTLIAAVAQEALTRAGRGPLKTFSVQYTGEEQYFQANPFQPQRDTPWAWEAARFLQTEHQAITLDAAQLTAALAEAMRARDLPGMADIDASLLLFCRAIKEAMPGAAVALAGEGADELFGGYPWFHMPAALAADTFPWSLRLEERTRLMAPDLLAAIDPHEYLRARYQEALAQVPRLPGEHPAAARRREIFHLTMFYWLPTLLDRQDRMAAAAGLGIRLPFLSRRLAEYAWNIPWEMKNLKGVPKGILRLAFEEEVSPPIAWRPKSPYPKTFNPEFLAAVQAGVREIISDGRSPLLDLINKPAVAALAGEGGSPTGHPWFGQLMTAPQMLAYLIQMDGWLREYRIQLV